MYTYRYEYQRENAIYHRFELTTIDIATNCISRKLFSAISLSLAILKVHSGHSMFLVIRILMILSAHKCVF